MAILINECEWPACFEGNKITLFYPLLGEVSEPYWKSVHSSQFVAWDYYTGSELLDFVAAAVVGFRCCCCCWSRLLLILLFLWIACAVACGFGFLERKVYQVCDFILPFWSCFVIIFNCLWIPDTIIHFLYFALFPIFLWVLLLKQKNVTNCDRTVYPRYYTILSISRAAWMLVFA